jgi:hypothetical protein
MPRRGYPRKRHFGRMIRRPAGQSGLYNFFYLFGFFKSDIKHFFASFSTKRAFEWRRKSRRFFFSRRWSKPTRLKNVI